MLKYLSIILYLVLSITALRAQEIIVKKKIDSLQQVNKKYLKQDSTKLLIYKELYRAYSRLNKTDSVERFVNKTIQLATALNYRVFIGDAYYKLAFYYHVNNKYFQAETVYQQALNEYTKLNNKKFMGDVYLNMSAMYASIPDLIKALDCNLRAIELYSEIKSEEDIASCYVNISSIYSDLKQQDIAIKYLEKAIVIFSKYKGEEYGIALSNLKLAEAYLNANDVELKNLNVSKSSRPKLIFSHLDKVFKNLSVDDNPSLSCNVNRIKGKIYSELNKREEALNSFLKAIEFSKLISGDKEYISSLLSLSEFYIKENKLSEAKKTLVEAEKISTENNGLQLRSEIFWLQYKVYEKQKNYAKALSYYKKYISVKEEIFNHDKEKEITRKKLQLDFNVKEKDYQNKQILTDLALQKQVALATLKAKELDLKQKELEIADQEKSIDRLNFLNKKVYLENEKNVLKRTQLNLELDKSKKETELKSKNIELKINRNITFFLILLVAFLLVSAIFIYKAQQKSVRLNNIINAQNLELEQLNQVKDRIFSVVSHDMRTPVNSLISFIQLLEIGNITPEKLNAYAKNLKKTLGYTSNMMLNLLSWASSQMQGYKPQLENINLYQCIDEVKNTLKNHLAEKEILLVVEINKDLVCYTDYNMLSLIVRNLLSNAIKFSQIKSKIFLTAHSSDDKIYLDFIDNGIGMAQEQVLHLNQSVTTNLKSTMGTNNEKGTGIGLALCKTFTSLINAQLILESEIGKGSKFTVVLPSKKI